MQNWCHPVGVESGYTGRAGDPDENGTHSHIARVDFSSPVAGPRLQIEQSYWAHRHPSVDSLHSRRHEDRHTTSRGYLWFYAFSKLDDFSQDNLIYLFFSLLFLCIKSREISEQDEASTSSSHGKAHPAAMFSLGQPSQKINHICRNTGRIWE